MRPGTWLTGAIFLGTGIAVTVALRAETPIAGHPPIREAIAQGGATYVSPASCVNGTCHQAVENPWYQERDGDPATAACLYARAARTAPTVPERDHLTRQAARLNARLRHRATGS